MDDGSFAGYPISLNEAKASKAKNGGLWTPRDALISMLRDIDSGEIAPEQLIVLYLKPTVTQDIGIYNCTPNSTVAAGICAKAMKWFS
jgi:hypothetical protein